MAERARNNRVVELIFFIIYGINATRNINQW
jgi:hypothetical protein